MRPGSRNPEAAWRELKPEVRKQARTRDIARHVWSQTDDLCGADASFRGGPTLCRGVGSRLTAPSASDSFTVRVVLPPRALVFFRAGGNPSLPSVWGRGGRMPVEIAEGFSWICKRVFRYSRPTGIGRG